MTGASPPSVASNIKKLAYSFGAVATALSYQAFSTYILYFYVDVIKLSVPLATIGMLIWGIWNAINDPLLGYLSDRTKTRWGRRIPYILFTALPFGLIYFLTWSPPFSSFEQLPLFLYFLTFICLFDLCYTITVLNWAALFPEMFRSLTERAEVNSYRQSFGMLGLMIGIAAPPLLFTTIGWSTMGAIFGALIAAAYLISLYGSKEKPAEGPQPNLFLALKQTLINRSFASFVFSNLFIQYAFTMVLALIPFFAKYILRVPEQNITYIMLSALLVAIPGMFLWRYLAVKFGAKPVYRAAILAFLLSLIPFLFLSSLSGAMISAVLVGLSFSGIILISDVLLSDVIDEDVLNSGARREGMYFGTNALVTRLAIGLEAASIGSVFILTEYNPVIFTQSREFLAGLRFLIAGLPIVALLLAHFLMRFYPLEGERLTWIKERLK